MEGRSLSAPATKRNTPVSPSIDGSWRTCDESPSPAPGCAGCFVCLGLVFVGSGVGPHFCRGRGRRKGSEKQPLRVYDEVARGTANQPGGSRRGRGQRSSRAGSTYGGAPGGAQNGGTPGPFLAAPPSKEAERAKALTAVEAFGVVLEVFAEVGVGDLAEGTGSLLDGLSS
jgi:hypothetical protein